MHKVLILWDAGISYTVACTMVKMQVLLLYSIDEGINCSNILEQDSLPIEPPPLWAVHEGMDGQLGFSQTVNGTPFYLQPVVKYVPGAESESKDVTQIPTFIPMVIGVPTAQYPINIYKLYTSK